MAQQTINIGTSPNDHTGDTLRDGGSKINANFTELYGLISATDVFRFRGNCDLSTNLFPITGGSGTAGAIQAYNVYFNTANSSSLLGPDGGIIPKGTFIIAKVNTPGQTVSNWWYIQTIVAT